MTLLLMPTVPGENQSKKNNQRISIYIYINLVFPTIGQSFLFFDQFPVSPQLPRHFSQRRSLTGESWPSATFARCGTSPITDITTMAAGLGQTNFFHVLNITQEIQGSPGNTKVDHLGNSWLFGAPVMHFTKAACQTSSAFLPAPTHCEA